MKAGQLTSLGAQLDRCEIQDFLHRSLGRFFVAFAGIELNLSLRVGGSGTFRDKLERFLEDADVLQDSYCSEYFERSAWYMAADAIRELRNRFAHGRWGFIVQSQSVAHVLGYPPGTQDERRYSLGQLVAIVLDAELLNAELSRFGMDGLNRSISSIVPVSRQAPCGT